MTGNRKEHQKPGWMSIPGGPKQPNFQEFKAKTEPIGAKRKELIEKLKALRGELPDGTNDAVVAAKEEKKRLQEQLKTIRDRREKYANLKENVLSERQNAQQKRRQLEMKVKEWTKELGSFQNINDIEQAINKVLRQMETGGGSLKAEKNALKRVEKLEKAKGMISELKTLQDSVKEAELEEKERDTEFQYIRQRLTTLNGQISTVYEEKKQIDEANKKSFEERAALQKETDTIRDQLKALSAEQDQCWSDYQAERKAWDEWREKANAIWLEQQAAKRKEREEAYQQKLAERKKIEKQRKMQEKLWEKQEEIKEINNVVDACKLCIRYLENKMNPAQKEKSTTTNNNNKAASAAPFDPLAVIPKGFTTVKYEDEMESMMLPLKKNKASKQQKAALKSAQKQAADLNKESEEDAQKKKDKRMIHSFDILRSFSHVGVTAPQSTSSIPTALENLKLKKEQNEGYIKDIEKQALIDSDDEEDDDEKKEDVVAEETKTTEE